MLESTARYLEIEVDDAFKISCTRLDIDLNRPDPRRHGRRRCHPEPRSPAAAITDSRRRRCGRAD
jgi:hypothetical protein